MSISRRDFLQLMSLAGASGLLPGSVFAMQQKPSDIYELPKFGNVTLMHFTDCHAQLLPIYFREPNVNIGLGSALGKPPHLVGNNLLKHFSIKPDSLEAHAFSYLNFSEAAKTYGKVGGFAHLATLVKRIRADRGAANCL
ncbi:MAG TPA: twin-arginine translocation signal domain-containing protein, partial [Gammaproteobacteria bacterium]|nr:twin-arginine translocation signal domain-containing protein [Gammaproteobacteria bacterium]